MKSQIEEFVSTTKISSSSINIYLRAVNCFLLWASDEDNNYIPAKKYIKKYKQKATTSIKAPYTQEEYELLLSHFRDKSNKEMYIFLQFLWQTGARVGEALAIKLSDLKLQHNKIDIPNKIFKGQREALLLTPEVVKLVEQAQELALERKDRKLFSWKETQSPNRIIKRVENSIGIKAESRGLHGFRRAFANRLFEQKLEITDIQEIMRHRDIKTTLQHYKEFKQQELIKKMSEKL